MKNLLKHRGPDSEGTFTSPYSILGHRLSIIDLNHGKQPMVSEDGRYALTYNGEIYNYLDLKEELKGRGITFNTTSDTEVLLKLLIADGDAALRKLNGMFAFAFHDTETGDWLVARDPFGVKPFYFTQTRNGQFIFASEIKALFAHPSVQKRCNANGLNHYMTFQFCLRDETLFKGITSLEPGFFLIGRAGSIQKKIRYWDTHFHVDESSTEDEFIERRDLA